ncbi:hypothetical protein HQ571_01190 [Candidatus Kuenenbacteria bacterium]|nr:hypothetical protein [Candidatus Kuenenbacteria bacterium]
MTKVHEEWITEMMERHAWVNDLAREFWDNSFRHEQVLELNSAISAGREERVKELHARLISSIHCNVCGTKIARGCMGAEQFGKRRKCDDCLEAERESDGKKYCRHCGRIYTKKEHYAGMKQPLDPKSFAAISCCPDCKTFAITIAKTCERLARESVQPLMERRDDLKRPVCRPELSVGDQAIFDQYGVDHSLFFKGTKPLFIQGIAKGHRPLLRALEQGFVPRCRIRHKEYGYEGELQSLTPVIRKDGMGTFMTKLLKAKVYYDGRLAFTVIGEFKIDEFEVM